jgi:hypothetical protein
MQLRGQQRSAQGKAAAPIPAGHGPGDRQLRGGRARNRATSGSSGIGTGRRHPPVPRPPHDQPRRDRSQRPTAGWEYRWQPLGTSSAVDTSADRQGEQPVADSADQLGNGHVICSGSRRCGWLLVAAWWVSFGTAVPFWSSFLADARHLPHGRSQAGTATSTSTARGQPRWRPSRAGIRPRGWVLHRSGTRRSGVAGVQ